MAEPSKKRILVVCPYPQDVAAAQRLKYEQYFDHFRRAGYEVDVHPFISNALWKVIYERGHVLKKIFWTLKGYFKRLTLLFRIRRYDVVYTFLWVTPFGKPLFEWLYAKLAKKLIYDIDDMVFLGHSSKANRRLQAIKGRSKMIYLMKQADHVITCTPVLDEIAKRYNINTSDISSTIDTDVYIPKTESVLSSPVCFGWSGSHSTSQYVLLLEPVFEELLARGFDFRVLVIGDMDFSFSNDRIPLEVLPWVRESEVEDLKKIDIGVYPLPDEPWVYGKSGLKALQYMALGIPTIATDVGTIVRIIQDGENGFLVKENEEWVNRMTTLASDGALRKKVSQAAVDTVQEKFSVHSVAPQYLEIMDGLWRQT